MLYGLDLWRLLAGLGIFQFGMYLMEESVRKISGRAFRQLIKKYTTGSVKSVVSGAFTTALLQSSTAVSLMTLAFVGAGIMNMGNALGVIYGANIGTTITGWIVATLGFKLDVESLALPLIGIGGLGLLLFSKSIRFVHVFRLLIGFGFLLLGLDFMKTSVEAFTQLFDLSRMPDYGIWFYVLIAIVLTGVMQSSAAMTAIVLTTLHAGILEFDSAVAMVIGANVGTTITVVLGALGSVQIKKRVAYGNLIFNIVSALIALIFLPIIVYIILEIFGMKRDLPMGLALFHTLFNVVGVLVFLPFIPLFTRWLTRLFPDRKTTRALYISGMPTDVPDAAMTAMKKEIIRLIHDVLRHNMSVLEIEEELVISDSIYPHVDDVDGSGEKYANLKLLQAEIFTFAAVIQTQTLTGEESDILNRYLHAARLALYAAKSMKDVKHNMEEFELTDNTFLSQQYSQFRKRILDTYLDIDRILSAPEAGNTSEEIFKLFASLQKQDAEFIELTVKAVNKQYIKDIEVSTILVVNRALYQSSQQILSAVKDLLLSGSELQQFERIQEIT